MNAYLRPLLPVPRNDPRARLPTLRTASRAPFLTWSSQQSSGEQLSSRSRSLPWGFLCVPELGFPSTFCKPPVRKMMKYLSPQKCSSDSGIPCLPVSNEKQIKNENFQFPVCRVSQLKKKTLQIIKVCLLSKGKYFLFFAYFNKKEILKVTVDNAWWMYQLREQSVCLRALLLYWSMVLSPGRCSEELKFRSS